MATTHNKSGFGSSKMDDKTKNETRSMGGKASAKSRKGAAGPTSAARRGGSNSHSN